MIIILPLAVGAADFRRATKERWNRFAFFLDRWRGVPQHPIFDSRGLANLRDKKMKQLLKLTAAPAAGLLALALTSITTPAAAAKYEYCRTDVSSAMRSCSFTSMEQCQAMSSGRGGTCARDPFLPEASNAYAYQPKGGLNRVRKPVQ